MVFELIIPIGIGLALLGLVHSTEAVLDLRQKQRDRGRDTKTYL